MKVVPLTVRAALVCSLTLMGCSTFGFGPTERIDVPVPVYCNPPTVSSPSRPVDALTDQADVFEFTRSLWATVETLEGYTEELQAAIAACRKPES